MSDVELEPNSVFSKRYRIGPRIGTGGFGSVYQCTHAVTGRRAAIKVLWPNLAKDADFRERFLRESRLAAQLQSEHIVEVLDAGIDEQTDTPFIVMELLDGEDLARRLKRKGRFTADETLVYLSQVAAALDVTHRASIVHRDLKPGNVFLTRRPTGEPLIKVLDFGIAKFATDEATRTGTGSAGTPLYMAPEQFRRAAATPAVDVYALGMLAFLLLVGSHYYAIEKRAAEHAYGLVLVLAEGPTEAASLRAQRYGVTLPPEFDPWFARAAHVSPGERFGSASEAILELTHALGLEAREPLVRRRAYRLTGGLTVGVDRDEIQWQPVPAVRSVRGDATEAGESPDAPYSTPNVEAQSAPPPVATARLHNGTLPLEKPKALPTLHSRGIVPSTLVMRPSPSDSPDTDLPTLDNTVLATLPTGAPSVASTPVMRPGSGRWLLLGVAGAGVLAVALLLIVAIGFMQRNSQPVGDALGRLPVPSLDEPVVPPTPTAVESAAPAQLQGVPTAFPKPASSPKVEPPTVKPAPAPAPTPAPAAVQPTATVRSGPAPASKPASAPKPPDIYSPE